MTIDTIRTEDKPTCPLCGSRGTALYTNQCDRLFGAVGSWSNWKCESSACRCVWLNPAPTSEELYKVYQNYYTHGHKSSARETIARSVYQRACTAYWSKYFGYPSSYTKVEGLLATILRLIPRRKAELDFLAFHLKYRSNGSLLEVGCGSGVHLKSLKKLGWSVLGVDVDSKAIKNCLEKGLPAAVGDLAMFEGQSELFDAIVMSHVIEHVKDPKEHFSKSFDLLKPGGTLVVITPNTDSLTHKIFKRNWMELDPPRHLTLFNKANISALANQRGFDSDCFTSIRFSDGCALTSLQIAVSGYGSMGNYGSLSRFFGKIFQFLNWILMHLFVYCGEELVLIAIKPNSQTIKK